MKLTFKQRVLLERIQSSPAPVSCDGRSWNDLRTLASAGLIRLNKKPTDSVRLQDSIEATYIVQGA